MEGHNTLSVQRVYELVMLNRVIRAPYYESNQKGIQWGADIIPALLDLFRLEKDSHDDKSWVGFAIHWKGNLFRLDLDLIPSPKDENPILVLTTITSVEDNAFVDEEFGKIVAPKQTPTKKEWEKRLRDYQAKRSEDTEDGSTAVKAYIDALPGWKRDLVLKIDHLIETEYPAVFRAIKWHAPFYGIKYDEWFAQIGTFSKYVKLTFIRGTSLKPEPPVEVKNQEGRCVHIKEKDEFDEDQISSWIRQAVALPGWSPKTG